MTEPPTASGGRPDETARLEAVAQRLRAAADASGFVPFDRFQEIALYSESVGYYVGPAARLGPEGDFYTASHVHPLFGATIGDRAVEEFERLGAPRRFTIAELGAGDGTLAASLLEAVAARLTARTDLTYLIVERSSSLLERATERLSTGPSASVVRSTEYLGADGPITGLVLANEFLDAQPTRRLRRDRDGWSELGASWDGTRFVEAARPARAVPGDLPADVPEGQVVEVSALGEGTPREVADHLQRGSVIFLDYGDDEANLLGTHPRGTLQALRGHRVLTDPLEAPGSADLSCFVNFTRLRSAASRAGLGEIAYGRQSEALVRWGLEQRLAGALGRTTSREEEVRLRLAVKNLLFGFEGFRALELSVGPVRASGP